MIILGNDHAAIEMKKYLYDYLVNEGYEVVDIGVNENLVDYYPETAKELCNKVLSNNGVGILLCGTGIGMSIAANKIYGIRAANCNIIEMARLAREHNDANVLTMGARIIDNDLAKEIVNIFLNTKFSNDERHINRINMLEVKK